MKTIDQRQWRVVDHGHYPGMVVIEGPETPITIITSAIDIDLSSHIRRVANARLIASAPTLLSALADCLKEMEIYSHVGHPGEEKGAAQFNVRFNFAKAALREALRGKQP